MALDIKVPSVGESITEVTLSRWLKKNGDHVEMDEVIAELESDKATFELTAEKAGTLVLKAGEGDTIAVGNVVASIEEGSDVAAAPQASAPPTAAPVANPQASVSAPVSAPPESGVSDASSKASDGTAPKTTYASGTPSPAAAKILAQHATDPSTLNGTGRDGRVTKDDALHAVALGSPATTSPPAISSAVKIQSSPSSSSAPAAEVPVPAFQSRNQRHEKLSNLRKTVGKRLVAVKNETAMLTTFNEVDMQPIMDLRTKYKDKFKEKYGVGLGFMSFFTKAVCEALSEYPAVNAMITADEVIYNDYADVAIAVSAPKGLVVPVIRNAESLSFAQIEKAIVELAGKARENKLTIEEMTGGTFTITNGGVFGSMLSTPIINPPQSAILGMHNIVERAVVVGGQVVVRPIMYVALSYDHRIIDGRESVSFLVKVKQNLEDPSRLLLGI